MAAVVEDITDLPPGVTGLRASEQFCIEDFDQVVTPRVEELIAAGEPVRLVLQLSPEFTGFGEGAWGDLTEHVLQLPFHRAAIVTDENKLAIAINVIKWTLRGDVRTFKNHEFDAAAAWAAS